MEIPATECPKCGKVMDRATGVGHDRRPKPGDLTICIGCAAVLIFQIDLGLKEVDEVYLRRRIPKEGREEIGRVRAAVLRRNYEDQVIDMAAHVRDYRARHGDQAIVYVLQAPKHVGVIGTLGDVLEHGILGGSPAAQDLARELVERYPGREPTWLMLRAAIEIAREGR